MQMIFLPAMALAFAAAPVAGQNFGARKVRARARDLPRRGDPGRGGDGASSPALVQWNPGIFARPFTSEPEVIAVCGEFLSYISWNFVAVGIVFTCSALFQALGNTWPSLCSQCVRLATLRRSPRSGWRTGPGFELRFMFLVSVASMLVQALVSYFWLKSEMDKRLKF